MSQTQKNAFNPRSQPGAVTYVSDEEEPPFGTGTFVVNDDGMVDAYTRQMVSTVGKTTSSKGNKPQP